nr:MAG TPA: hypothetical protein [Caudoviricetes sp.]
MKLLINFILLIILSYVLEESFKLVKPYKHIIISIVILSVVLIIFNSFDLLF